MKARGLAGIRLYQDTSSTKNVIEAILTEHLHALMDLKNTLGQSDASLELGPHILKRSMTYLVQKDTLSVKF